MTNSLPLLEEVEPLEYKLERQEAAHERMVIIDRLLGYYVFTDIRRAEALLAEQGKILQKNLDDQSKWDYRLTFHQNKAIVANMRYQYKLSTQHFQDAIQLVDMVGTAQQQAEVYIDYTGTCINANQIEKAKAYLGKAEKMLKKFPDFRLQARITARYGFISLLAKDYSKATELLLEADKQLSILPETLDVKDYYFLSLIHSGLGNLFEKNDDHERSIQSYMKVVSMAESMDMRSRLSWNYLNLGNAFLAKNDLENAGTYFLKAVQNPDDINPISHASAYANLGYCALKKEAHQQCLSLLEKAQRLFEEYEPDVLENHGNITSWRAQAFAALGKEKEALDEFNMAIRIADELDDYKLLSATYENMAEFYADQENWETAYHYQVMHSKYSDLYVRQVNEQRQWELEVKYDAEKKRQEAKLLRLKATKLQLKALRAQMNPHFLYNALNSIQNYITSNKGDHAAKYLAKFAKLMRQSLEYSDLEIISLEKEIEFLHDYLYINETLRFEDKLTYEIHVEDDIEEDILGVPTMIVQPYVENAIEHGLRTKKHGLIKVHFSLADEQTILCVVEDNGIGRKKAREMQLQDEEYQNHKSRGTKITEERLRILHSGDESKLFVQIIDLKDKRGRAQGTRVEIKIPIVDIHMR